MAYIFNKRKVLIFSSDGSLNPELFDMLDAYDTYTTDDLEIALSHLAKKPEVVLLDAPLDLQIRFYEAFQQQTEEEPKDVRLFTPINTISIYEGPQERKSLKLYVRYFIPKAEAQDKQILFDAIEQALYQVEERRNLIGDASVATEIIHSQTRMRPHSQEAFSTLQIAINDMAKILVRYEQELFKGYSDDEILIQSGIRKGLNRSEIVKDIELTKNISRRHARRIVEAYEHEFNIKLKKKGT